MSYPKYHARRHWRTTVAPFALGAALIASPAFAQDTSKTPTPAPAASDNTPEIVVTGSILRNPSAATAAPLTTVTAQDLGDRNITTISDALQQLAANNGGTDPASWSAFGFATGASAPSLRGLNDAYTLTIFDGLRSAVYPLGDDGYRSFVDINSIPESIVDRVDVLQEGASSTYGSDAIAGVVNVVVKKQVTGVHLNGSTGISQRGDAAEQRIDATLGYGDLGKDGFNVYVNGEYQHNDPLYLRDRGYPYNTGDQSKICNAAGSCRSNSITNGIQADGSYSGFGATTVGFVRPYDNTAGVGLAPFQLLNPSKGCQNLRAQPLTAAQQASTADSTTGINEAPATVCQEDNVAQNYQFNSDIKRFGGNIHATVNIGSRAQAYAMFNFYEVKTSQNLYYQLNFAGGQIQTPNGTNFLPAPLLLPVYVCANGVGNADPTLTGCNAANGRLNPNNPFAAAGQVAELSERFASLSQTLTDARTFRFAGGIHGTFGTNWNYNVEATTSWVDLGVANLNYFNGQALLNAIARGTYNFVDQSANTPAAIAAIAPRDATKSSSRLTEVKVTLEKELFALPGGHVNVAVGGAYRFEALNNPSANPGNPTNPYDAFVTVNPVGAVGSRRVYSGFYEIDAPILKALELQAQGRYDSYSSGQSNFSPKFTAAFTPFHQLKIRGTYSQGFRVPSFNQAYGLPTTGYVSTTIDCTNAVYQAFCAAHASNPQYYTYQSGSYQYGLTSVGNNALSSEKARSFTGGLVFQPTRRLTFTVDYFNTKITNIIVPALPDQSLIQQYYQNNGVVSAPPGVQYLPGSPDPSNPTALPILGFIAASYTNADSEIVSGLDFSATARFPLGSGGTKLISNFSGTYLIKLALTTPSGTQRYDGSLSPCNITSCSGSPAFRANWSNTIDFNDKARVTLTAYYTSGYDLASSDYGGVPGNCTASIGASVVTYNDGTPVLCRAHGTFDLDINGQIKVGHGLTLYGGITNLIDSKPVYDPSAAYGLYQFNPAWDEKQFIGRYFRFGAKVDL